MVEILRNKWCEDLEDILQCPVCMVCPIKVAIYQCTEGHHICYDCYESIRVKLCPSCGNGFTVHRNRVAEDLCLKFDDIKLSLIDPEAEINKLLIPDKLCASTQTDNLEAIPATQVAESHSGTYRCCIDTCEVRMCFEPLMVHIKSEHLMRFVELPVDSSLLFEHSWFFNYTENFTLDRVFLIRDVGTFILKLATDKSGDFTGYIMMLHSGFVSKQFTYQLQISCGAEPCHKYTDSVNSCRSPTTIFQEKCLRVKSVDMRKLCENGKVVKSTVLLSRKLQSDEPQLPKVNGQNKKRRKNRNKDAKATVANIQSAYIPPVNRV